MAIADRVYSLRQRPTYDLRINGVSIVPDQPLSLDGRPAVYAMRGGESYDEESRVATPPWLELEVSRIPKNWMDVGMSVQLDAGYDLEHVRLFTGGVWALGEEDRDYLRTQIIGTGATAADGSRIEQTASLIGGPAVWPPIPAGQYIDAGVDNHLAHTDEKLAEVVARELSRRARIPRRPNDSKERQRIQCKGDLVGAFRDFKIPARDLSGLTVEASIEGILDDSGIAQRNVNVGSFTLASEGATLDRMPGAGMLKPLLELQGAHVQQLKSGLVTARVIDLQPAPTSAFTYSTTVQQYARIVNADPPLLRVPFNPLLQIGQTITLQLDYLGVDARFFLYAHEWEIGPAGAWSYLDLRGGDEFGGTVGINPTASFTYSIAQQVIGSELYYVVTFTDTSTDADGSIDQSLSTWTDNQTTTPEITTFDGEPVATVMIAASALSGDWIVTRTVVDNDGLTDSVPVTLDLTAASSAVTVPPFFVAAGTRRMATPDGAQTFNDSTPTAKTATAVGARLANGIDTGHAVMGHSDGSLDVTRDFGVTWTAALAAVGSQFNDVVWDWRDQRLVWAITENGKLYLSNDYGASFFLLTDFRTLTYGGFGGTTAGALGDQIGLPGAGGVYIFGGGGDGRPLIAYNVNPFAAGEQWIRVTFTGDLLTDLVTPADATMRIKSFTAPGYKGGTMILSWASGGEATLVAIYHTNDEPGPSANYTRATGLTAGLKNGRVIMESGPLSPVSRIAMFGDRDVWQSLDGIAYTEISDALPVGFTPNHGIFGSSVLTPMSAVYEHLLAVEDSTGTGGVMKSIDDGATWNFIRGPSTLVAWVPGAKAKKIAIGAPGATAPAGSSKIAIVKSGKISYLDGTTWTEVSLPANIDGSRPRVYPITSSNWIVVDATGFPRETEVAKKASRTEDGGATWADAAIGDEVNAADPLRGLTHICKGADGTLWGARQAGDDTGDPVRVHVYYSINEGASWTLESTLSVAGQLRYPVRLIAHPTNAVVVALIAINSSASDKVVTHYRSSGALGSGVWTTNQVASTPTMDEGNAIIGKGALMLANGRIILTINEAGFGTPDTFCYTSDNGGASYTLRQTIANTEHFSILAGADLSKIVLFRPNVTTVPGTDMFAYQSLDEGQSYAPVGPAFPNNAVSGSNWSAKYADGRLYVVNGEDTSGAGRVYMLTPVSDAGEWTDITYNLAAGGSAWDALAVIP